MKLDILLVIYKILFCYMMFPKSKPKKIIAPITYKHSIYLRKHNVLTLRVLAPTAKHINTVQ